MFLFFQYDIFSDSGQLEVHIPSVFKLTVYVCPAIYDHYENLVRHNWEIKSTVCHFDLSNLPLSVCCSYLKSDQRILLCLTKIVIQYLKQFLFYL